MKSILIMKEGSATVYEKHAVRNLDKIPAEFSFASALREAFGMSAHFRQVPVSLLCDIGHEMLSLRVEPFTAYGQRQLHYQTKTDGE